MSNRYSCLAVVSTAALFCFQSVAGVELADCEAAMAKKTDDQVVLESSDGKCVTLEVGVASQSETIKNLISDTGTENKITLPNIDDATLKGVADLMEDIFKKPDQKVNEVKKKLLDYKPEQLVQIIKAANYLDHGDILLVGLDLISKKIFETDLEILKSWNTEAYTTYKLDFLDALPKDLQRPMIERNLRSIDRVFVTTTKDRRIDAIEQLDLASAQVIAFIDKNQTPSSDKLPEFLKGALSKGTPAEKILFGPLPEFAIWPAHCPLPSDRDYNMYSGTKPNERYVDNKDGTVTDVCTRLIWEKVPLTRWVTWLEAKTHCANLVKAEVEDWRAPNLIELQSIVDYSKKEPALNAVLDESNESFWSSSALVGSPNNAWDVHFRFGVVLSSGIDANNRVRCVR